MASTNISLNAAAAAATAAKSHQSYLTLCDPIDGSPPGSLVPGILQTRTLEWVAIPFSNAWKWKVKVKSFTRVGLFAIPWTATHQAPLSMGFSRQEYWSGAPVPSPISLNSLPKNPPSVIPFSLLPRDLHSYPESLRLWGTKLVCTHSSEGGGTVQSWSRYWCKVFQVEGTAEQRLRTVFESRERQGESEGELARKHSPHLVQPDRYSKTQGFE